MWKSWRSIFKKRPTDATLEYPSSMLDLGANSPCWCGSEKPYKKCHRPEDRRREKELGINRKRTSICEAFL